MTEEARAPGAEEVPADVLAAAEAVDNARESVENPSPPPEAEPELMEPGQGTDPAELVGLLSMLFGSGFEVLAPKWGVTPAESKALADAWAGPLLPYYERWLGDGGPWFAALAVTATVIGPRLGEPRADLGDGTDTQADTPPLTPEEQALNGGQ